METAKNITLTVLTPELHDALLEMAAEYHAAGEERYTYASPDMSWEDFTALLQRLDEDARSEDVLSGRAPQTTYWLVRDGHELIGSSRLRHLLTPLLEKEGGHIGYDIRPSQRGKGYGTQILRLTLEKARELGLERVLVTCDDDNYASARIIEKNGGVLMDKVLLDESGELVRRYWIEL